MVALVVVVMGLLVWMVVKKPSTTDTASDNNIISRNGLHYHPKLDIYIKGRPQTIPSGVGLGAAHQPIHTHDADHIIHLEMTGLVTVDNTRLGEFFRIWDKQFNSNCIFDFCNGASGTVKMFVNGQPNSDFEKYPMKNDDKIEIRYE